jgi:predicted Fe-S protein YdhL (DUF1289 family)
MGDIARAARHRQDGSKKKTREEIKRWLSQSQAEKRLIFVKVEKEKGSGLAVRPGIARTSRAIPGY